MRKPFAMLIILAGLVLLTLGSPNQRIPAISASHNPSFFERGTYADCDARNQKRPTSELVADAKTR